MLYWKSCLLFLLSLACASPPEGNDEPEQTQNFETPQSPQVSGIFDSEIPLTQPSNPPSQSFEQPWPDRQPSFDGSPFLSSQEEPQPISTFAGNYILLEQLRAEGLIERHMEDPDELFKDISFQTIRVLFESEPEKQFLLSNMHSRVLAQKLLIFHLERAEIQKMNLSLDFLEFIVKVLDSTGLLDDAALIRHVDSFPEGFKAPENMVKYLQYFSPIQMSFSRENDMLFLGIRLPAGSFENDEQFHTWNLSSWLFKKALEAFGGNAEIVNVDRQTVAKDLSSDRQAAFDLLESSDSSSIVVADLARDWFGFSLADTNFSIDYNSLSTTKRIQFRFIMYLCLTLPSNNEQNLPLFEDLYWSFVNYTGSAEHIGLYESIYFIDLCVANPELGSFPLVRYYAKSQSSRFSKLIKDRVKPQHVVNFKNPIHQVSLALNHEYSADILNDESLFKRRMNLQDQPEIQEVTDTNARSGDDEDGSVAQNTLAFEAVAVDGSRHRRKRDVFEATQPSRYSQNEDKRRRVDYLQDHFLSEEQLCALFGADYFVEQVGFRLEIVYPDKTYLEARLGHFLQNLESPDFGESDWKANKIADPEKDEQIKKFVMGGFELVHKLMHSRFDRGMLRFKGSTSYGRGLILEALNMLGRVCILPFLELFMYDSRLKGFLPLPLLAPEMMAHLGYLSGLLILYDMPVNWNIAPAYSAFLNYVERLDEPLSYLAEYLYAPIFSNFYVLASYVDGGDLLDYIPTVITSHFPFPLKYCKRDFPERRLNLYSAGAGTTGCYLRLDALLPDKKALLLQSPDLFESKTEDEDATALIEHKSSEPSVQERFYARTEFVNAMKPILLDDIALRMKLGRFEFQRHLLRVFRPSFHEMMLSSDLMARYWTATEKPFTAEDIKSGLLFSNEDLLVQVDDDSGAVATISAGEAFETILDSCSENDLRQFYWFVTGSHQLPANNLSIHPILVHFVNEKGLSVARTCFRRIDLRVNSSLSEMKRLFLYSIYNFYGFAHEEEE